MILSKKVRLVVLATTMLCSTLGGFNLMAAESYNWEIQPLSGSQSELLLQNPDKGLRIETYMNVKTGKSMFDSKNEDAIEQLRKELAYYESDQPRLAQVYFYLTDYRNKDLDAKAFENMNKYFEELEKHNVKAVLRFAYIWDENKIWLQSASTATMVKHMKQLQPFLEEHRDQINVLQSGMIGPWGEWHSQPGVDTRQVLNAQLDYTPEDLFIQVRNVSDKNNNIDKNDEAKWNRVGFHDDFLVGAPHEWNTPGGDPNSADWQQMTEESAYTIVDGEMPWGRANVTFTDGKSIDSIQMARRLQEHHFTSLSMTHNYKEPVGADAVYSMAEWHNDLINSRILDENGLRYEPEWFKDENGQTIERTMFEYVRDYLGYYLVVEEAQVEVDEQTIQVDIQMDNYGFAAPLGLDTFEIVLLDADYNEVDTKPGCEISLLQPESVQSISVAFEKPQADGIYQVAIKLRAPGDIPVRLANQLTYYKGYNVLGVLSK